VAILFLDVTHLLFSVEQDLQGLIISLIEKLDLRSP
jgi:hypothetical protein